MTSDNKNGWNEWSNKVLGDLKDLKELYKELSDDIVKLKIQMAIIKTKAIIYGTLCGGAAAIIISAIIKFLVKSTLG